MPNNLITIGRINGLKEALKMLKDGYTPEDIEAYIQALNDKLARA